MIIAIAGRRVDPTETREGRFPLRNVPLVKSRVRKTLQTEGATAIVCSAACGSDLIALGEAGALNLRRRVVLPFAEDRFRQRSVVDRPGDWGPLYDGILASVKERGDLVILQKMPESEALAVANMTILDEASTLAEQSGNAVMAILIWDLASRGAKDRTDQFGSEAHKRGWRVAEVSTLE